MGIRLYTLKTFSEILIPHFQAYMNAIREGTEMRKEVLGALCSSFRPISLINKDIKLYAKILAERLKRYMSDWIDKD